MNNNDIAEALYQLSEQLEGQGENHYRVRAYRRAANTIKKQSDDLVQLINMGFDLTTLPWIGKHMAQHIVTIVQTGKLPQFKEFSVADKIRLGKKRKKNYTRRTKIYYAIPVIESLVASLQELKEVVTVEVGRSYRRRKEVVGNVDIFITTKFPDKVLDAFINLYIVREVLELKKSSASVILRSGTQVTLFIVPDNQRASALLHSTGNKNHFVELKKIARQKKLTLNAKGLFKDKKKISTPTEEDIYQQLGFLYIEPELRENRGELNAAKNNSLPHLIQLSDIKGDLHCHTLETDGTETLEVMANAAKALNYDYVAITDHTKSLKITNGLDEKRLAKQIKLIDKLNEKLNGFKILKSSEVDILEDGSLDLPDWILKECDIRVCSVHSKFRMSKEQQTERIIRAMDNPYFNILGHATGRLINSRPGYEIEVEKIFRAAKERNCFIELNSQPARLDINDVYCMLAKQMGVKVAISSDAHTPRGFNFMRLGVNQARRGWLEASDVINTRSLKDLKKLIAK